MATKSYSKHKEYKEFSSSSRGNVEPFAGEQFDMLKSELIPKGSKLETIGRDGQGHREYHYEYKEEKHPSGKYDRKDLHTVEEFTVPPKRTSKPKDSSTYYYEREERELPAITSGSRTYNYESNSSSTPGYSKVKSTKVTKDLSHNVEELDSLLDDLQKDQERQLYKSGYTSDTADSSSFDYRRGLSPVSSTPVKAPSSGYSTLKREERLETSSWGASSPPPPVTRATEVKHEMFREEKTESRVVPSQVSPALPLPVPPAQCINCHHSNTSTLTRSGAPMNKVTTTVKTYTYEVPADTQMPLHETYLSSTENNISSHNKLVAAPAPAPGCQYCSHCNASVTHTHLTSTDERTSERMVYPTASNQTKVLSSETRNGLTPHGPTHYKYSETTYSAHNSTERLPPAPPASFPRPSTPSAGLQQPPKKLDDLLADFPEARFPTQPDGVVQRKIEVSKESRDTQPSRNAAGPPVYYPPGHTPFQKSEAYSASAMQGGGAHASGRGMYEYESGARSKEKHSEKKTAVPICLPLCCAMPCVIM